MIDQLPEEMQGIIVKNLNTLEQRRLNTAIKLQQSIKRSILEMTSISGKKIILAVMLRNNIRKLFATLDAYMPSYTYSLCNYSSVYLPYRNECLLFAPKDQSRPFCRFCGKYKIDHKYWKMINIYFQSRNIF